MKRFLETWRSLGPGLLYAGAAVGVSHLVQSTRAGADYGFYLMWILIFANFIKYPFFEFAPRYVAATNQNLVQGYSLLGRKALLLFMLLQICTMFAILAAVTMVTSGIIGGISGLSFNPAILSVLLLLLLSIVLLWGKYRTLDKLIRYIILLLSLSTLLALLYALNQPFETGNDFQKTFSWVNPVHLLFLIAFVGWMPSPIDVSVWHSVWSVEKRAQQDGKLSLKQSLFDFRLGYIGTAFLAMCFLSLGALVLYSSPEQLSEKGDEFAVQFMGMYSLTIGPWAFWLIGVAALTTMLSTSLTCMDAYPRVLAPATRMICKGYYPLKYSENQLFIFWMLVLLVGTSILLLLIPGSMRWMVDLATTISFVTAPVLAILNYLTITHRHVPEAFRPGLGLRIWAWTGIIFLSLFSFVFILWRFFPEFTMALIP